MNWNKRFNYNYIIIFKYLNKGAEARIFLPEAITMLKDYASS
jgi:hypothetical protein